MEEIYPIQYEESFTIWTSTKGIIMQFDIACLLVGSVLKTNKSTCTQNVLNLINFVSNTF